MRRWSTPPRPSRPSLAQSCSVVINTNKLHGTLETAVALSTVHVEQGVTASMLPVQVVANKKQESVEKELPSPTGKKGCALFDFEGQKEADLSFNKGAIIDLTHTVNENALINFYFYFLLLFVHLSYLCFCFINNCLNKCIIYFLVFIIKFWLLS